jgi:hypothetical protein
VIVGDPAHWRDAWQMEHTLGKYIISDRPMTEQEWIDAKANVIDVTPEKDDQQSKSNSRHQIGVPTGSKTARNAGKPHVSVSAAPVQK